MMKLKDFTMGIRVYYNEQQVDAIPPTLVEGGLIGILIMFGEI